MLQKIIVSAIKQAYQETSALGRVGILVARPEAAKAGKESSRESRDNALDADRNKPYAYQINVDRSARNLTEA